MRVIENVDQSVCFSRSVTLSSQLRNFGVGTRANTDQTVDKGLKT